MVLSLFFTPTIVEAANPLIAPITTPSVNRTWDNVSLLYPDQYHNNSMLMEEISIVQDSAPDVVDIEVIGESWYNEEIVSIRITNENSRQQKAKTLVVAHHHGREKVTVEIAIRFIFWLVNGYGTDDRITDFVDYQEIYIIPTLNPDALNYIYETGSPFLRKNMHPFDDDGDGLFDEDDREDMNDDGIISLYEVYEKDGFGGLNWLYDYYEGYDNDGDGLVNEDVVGLVDLNRNYNAYWSIGSGALVDPMNQQFAGFYPFSEPETEAFRDFAIQHRFAMSYSLHTGVNATYFPTNSTGQYNEVDLYSLMWEDLQDILPPSYLTNPYYNPVAELHGELATTPGGWDTWMYDSRDCQVPISLEIYQNATGFSEEMYFVAFENETHVIKQWNSMFELFSPYESAINPLWLELIPTFEYLLLQTPQLEVNLNTISLENNTITANLTASVHSPRISTIYPVQIQLLDGFVLDEISAIDADSTVVEIIHLEFTDLELSSNTQFEVGNEFSGYYRFVVYFIVGVNYVPLLFGGTIIAAFAVVVVLVIIRRR